MKVTNKQLLILAEDLYKKHFESAYQKELAEHERLKNKVTLTATEKKIAKDAEKAINRYNQLYKQVGSHYNFFSYDSLENSILKFKKSSIKFVRKTPTVNQIESDLTLAMISSTDLGDLMKSIKSKYNLK